MLNEKKILTRAQLYDLVWSTPMFELCKQFHLSDNGLRKICRKYIIPIPKMGHWQKVRFGKTPKKPSLPDYKGEDKILIKMMPRIKETLEPSQLITEPVLVPEQVSKFHPLIKQTKGLFKGTSKDKGRYRVGRNEKALDIRVGSESLSRALKIMDTIIKALESKGVQVAIESEQDQKAFTCAHIDGEKVIFGLEERSKIIKIQNPKYSWMDTEFVPTGSLSLCIKSYFLSGCQTKWSDGKQDKLEQKITSFLNGLFFAAAYIKKESLRREEESKRWAEERKENERKAQELEEEKKKIQLLEQQAESWQKSRLIKALVRDAVKRQGAYSSSSFDKWVSRAKAYAEQLDPLRSLPLKEPTS